MMGEEKPEVLEAVLNEAVDLENIPVCNEIFVYTQGAITKRMTAIEEMAGMDVLCSDKRGTLTLNKLTVDRNLIVVFAKGIGAGTVVLLAARASRTENQDAIDGATVGMLADPKEVVF